MLRGENAAPYERFDRLAYASLRSKGHACVPKLGGCPHFVGSAVNMRAIER